MIESRREGQVTVLRLQHGKANALDLELLEEMDGRLAALGNGEDAVVLTGTGSIFSAGVDLFRLTGGGAAYVERFLPALVVACERLLAFPRPLVVAINGHAMAGGWIFACASDYRLMADGRGKLGTPELQVGVPFPPMALEAMRLGTPPQLLGAMIFGGRTFGAEEGLRLGLVDEVTPPEALLPRAIEVAAAMAAIPAAAFRLTKAQLRQPAIERARAARDVDAAAAAQWASPQTAEVIRGYLQRVVGRSA